MKGKLQDADMLNQGASQNKNFDILTLCKMASVLNKSVVVIVDEDSEYIDMLEKQGWKKIDYNGRVAMEWSKTKAIEYRVEEDENEDN